MSAKHQAFEEALSRIVSQLKEAGAKKIILFGSLGRGKVRSASDIDILAIFDDGDNFKSRIRRLYNTIESDVDFDLLPYGRDEFERVRTRSLFRRILNEGRVVYEA